MADRPAPAPARTLLLALVLFAEVVVVVAAVGMILAGVSTVLAVIVAGVGLTALSGLQLRAITQPRRRAADERLASAVDEEADARRADVGAHDGPPHHAVAPDAAPGPTSPPRD